MESSAKGPTTDVSILYVSGPHARRGVCRDLKYVTGYSKLFAEGKGGILVIVEVDIVEEQESEERLADGHSLASTLLRCGLR
jgi:hypothetical protein